MAKIYQRKNALDAEYTTMKRKLKRTSTLCGVCFFLWMANIMIFHSFNPLFIFLVFGGFCISGLRAGYLGKRVRVLEAGVEGENNTALFIRTLPDTYSAITNVKVEYDGKTSELDTVVVCPEGVFIIETKNHNGLICGDSSDDKLTQHKVGRGGTPYSNQFYNPIKQVSTHVYRLSNFLRENGIRVWLQGMVYFANPEAEVEVECDFKKVPVFSKANDGEREIAAYIENYNPGNKLDRHTIDRIVRLLVKE